MSSANLRNTWEVEYTEEYELIRSYCCTDEQQLHFQGFKCESNDSYTRYGAYEENLHAALSFVHSADKGSGFYNYSAGEDNDIVNSSALCRGDIHMDVCRICLLESVATIREVCPFKKEAAVYYDECLLMYYNKFPQQSLLLASLQDKVIVNVPTVSEDWLQLREALRPLLEELINSVSIVPGVSPPLFRSGNKTRPGATDIYGLVQCTPNLSLNECNYCLQNAMNMLYYKFDESIGGKDGGRIFQPTCILMYGSSPFFNADTLVRSPPQGKSSNAKMIIIVVIITTLCVMIIMAFIYVLLRIRKKKKNQQMPRIYNNPSYTMDISDPECLVYDFSLVKIATNNFSDEAMLGRGGFGAVYKGTLETGQEIAVKRLQSNASQGDLEFKNEVLIHAKLQHRNLVRLLGYSIDGTERLLVYEFMSNASFDKILFDSSKREYLDWVTRYKIITSVAKGLLYLHEESRLRIIHRDLKASNILLDDKLNAKIADFGMAKLFKHEETHGDTNRVVGTFGYMAPEYVMNGKFSVKSDVFSYGVLMLETITGQKNQSFHDGGNPEFFLSFVWKCWQNGTPTRLIDPLMKRESCLVDDIVRSIHIGLLCVQENVAYRPTMDLIVQMLTSSSYALPVPSEPAFLMQNSHQFDLVRSISDVSISDIIPR